MVIYFIKEFVLGIELKFEIKIKIIVNFCLKLDFVYGSKILIDGDYYL